MIARVYIILSAVLLTAGTLQAQNLNPTNGGYEGKKIINNKTFHVLYEEVIIDRSVDEVWNEVAGNFVNIADIVKSVNSSRSLNPAITTGLGAERQCELEFQGKHILLKERIIDFKECGDHREFTYDVYESVGIPLKSYNTWVVRKGDDGKTYLGTVSIFRAKFALLTALIAKKLQKTGLREGILAYKHYLETGARKLDPEKLNELYP